MGLLRFSVAMSLDSGRSEYHELGVWAHEVETGFHGRLRENTVFPGRDSSSLKDPLCTLTACSAKAKPSPYSPFDLFVLKVSKI
jgi:hypothetical protein